MATEQLEQIPTGDLIPYARNSRAHSAEQVTQLAASIHEFGFCAPILIDEDSQIIAGHGRVMAAQKLKLETVPCRRLGHLSEAQKRAYVIADNRLAENATWDQELLTNELSDLHADDFDVDLLGFEADELESLLGLEPNKGEIVEDEVPEPPADPVTQPGDLWLLGDHRVLCGDSTKTEDVERLMDGEKAQCVVADPPYGISLDRNLPATKGKVDRRPVDGDDNLLCVESLFRTLEIPAVVWGANCFPSLLPKRGRWICWDKRLDERADKMLGSPFELAWSSRDSGFDKIIRCLHGGVVNADGGKRFHPTQKPVQVITECLAYIGCTESVYDPFLGSGTTLLAAEQLGRKCYGMEISPQYCDVIIQRWEKLTGNTATKE